ncbi:MAG: hypothetical protein ABI633_10610 [Burkholderiales bacterium]
MTAIGNCVPPTPEISTRNCACAGAPNDSANIDALAANRPRRDQNGGARVSRCIKFDPYSLLLSPMGARAAIIGGTK